MDTPPPADAAPAPSPPPRSLSPLPSRSPSKPLGALHWPLVIVLLVLSWALIAGVRYSAPPDLLDNDQWLTSSYTVDIAANGEWLAQRDPLGRPATKPPLHPWLAAAISAPFGQVTWLTAGLPAALATLATALLAATAAGRWFGPGIGLLAGAATLASPVAVKHVWLVRPDAVFMLTVFAGALLAWRAWDRGRGWIWVWIAAAVVTLAKTPFGIPLMLAGLLAALTVRSPRAPESSNGAALLSPRRRNFLEHLVGLSLFTLIVAGWFFAARWRLGDAFTQTALGDELTRHALGGDSDEYLGKGFLRAPWYFLARLAPWSFITCIAMWRLWTNPSSEIRTRRLERFLFFSIVGGLFIVGFASRPRAEHILPLAPFVVILAARELALWPFFASRKRVIGAAAFAGLIAAGAAFGQYHIERRDHPYVVTGRAMASMAEVLLPLVKSGAVFADVDAPYALQFGLGSMQVRVSVDEAAALLATDAPVMVFATAESAALVDAADPAPAIELARWPTDGEAQVIVLGNEAAVRLRTLKGR